MNKEKENSKKSNDKSELKEKKTSAKQKNVAAQLAQTFLGITLLIFAAYFAIHFQNETRRPKLKQKVTTQTPEQTSNEVKLSEIQEKIFEKINLQPDLTEKLSSLDQISFKPQITNQKIIDQLKGEFERTFVRSSNGEINMEVDIFNDDDQTSKVSAENKADNEYAGTDSNIVLQVSLFEKKSSNKVGELGISLPIKMFIVKSE